MVIPSDLNLLRYLRFVKPSYDNFVRPTAAYADIVSSTLISTTSPRNVTPDCTRFQQRSGNRPHMYSHPAEI